jgi:hypothetical protein
MCFPKAHFREQYEADEECCALRYDPQLNANPLFEIKLLTVETVISTTSKKGLSKLRVSSHGEFYIKK